MLMSTEVFYYFIITAISMPLPQSNLPGQYFPKKYPTYPSQVPYLPILTDLSRGIFLQNVRTTITEKCSPRQETGWSEFLVSAGLMCPCPHTICILK